MLYYSNKARETARARIAELIPVLASVPFNVIEYDDVNTIIMYLQTMDWELAKEIRDENKRIAEKNKKIAE